MLSHEWSLDAPRPVRLTKGVLTPSTNRLMMGVGIGRSF